MIAKSISREPRAYRHRTMTAIAAGELLRQGVRLQPGETIHYVITDAAAPLAEDRVRAVATLDGAWSYDARAYETLLLKSARVILAPLGLDQTDLDNLTNPRT